MSSIVAKKNVNVFNSDVASNQGYKYTSNAPFSSIVANKRITDETLRIIKKFNCNLIVDAGCGDGTYTNNLKIELPNIQFEGFDPADIAIKSAAKKYTDNRFWVGNILEKKTLENRPKYDLAIIRGVLHHLPTVPEALENIKILSNRIVIIEPNGNNPILKIIEKKSAYHIQHEEQSFSSDQLKNWCLNAGYKIRKVDFIGFVPFFFPTIFAKIIYFFQPLLELIYPLKKYLGAQIVIICEKE